MIRGIFTWFCFLFASFAVAQNLVPNHSFEEKTGCPVIRGSSKLVQDWFGSYAEYYNRCGTPNTSIPHNADGHQECIDGDAYIGIMSYNKLTTDERYYFGCHLLSPLTAGTKYYVSFKIVSMDFGPRPTPRLPYSNGTGIRFFNNMDAVKISTLKPDNRSHVYIKTILTDTVNWTLVADTFTADSDYTDLVIANFFNDSNTLIQFPNKNDNFYLYQARYYLDDVHVEEIIDLKASQNAICKGDSALIRYGGKGTASWSTSTQPNDTLERGPELHVAPEHSETYLLHLNNKTYPVHIEVDTPVTPELESKLEICETDPLPLSAAAWPDVRYSWSNGDTTSTIYVHHEGIYTVTARHGQCVSQDTCEVAVCNTYLFFPTAFSPNADGLNDVFAPTGARIEQYHLEVYNRWGALVFETVDYTKGWDGNLAPEGVYAWVARYRKMDNVLPKERFVTGTVTLIR